MWKEKTFASFVGCTIFNLTSQLEDRRRLGKIQINLLFRSPCTIFAAENEVDRFEQLATTVKNAKTQPSVAVCILSTIPIGLDCFTF